MLDRFDPSVIVLPLVGRGGFHRSDRVRTAIQALADECFRRSIPVVYMTPSKVRKGFGDMVGRAVTSTEVNQVIVRRFPELTTSLPRRRRPYDPEEYFTPLFTAVAMCIAWRHCQPR